MTAGLSRTFWRQALPHLLLLAAYGCSTALFLSWFIPEHLANVNRSFAGGAGRLSLLAAGLCLALSMLLRSPPVDRTRGRASGLRAGDLLLVLLPITPVFQYVLNNGDVLGLSDALFLLGVFSAVSFLCIIVIPWLVHAVAPAPTAALLGAAFVFSITNMASLSRELAWYEKGNLAVQVAFLAATVATGWIVCARFSRRHLYALIVVYFAANSLAQWNRVRQDRGASPAAGSGAGGRSLAAMIGRKPLRTPGIYLLVYDAYVANETLRQYGIQNQLQEQYLTGRGFTLYPHTYSVGADSLRSMNRVLEAELLFQDRLRRGVSGNGAVHHLLKASGYETYGVFHNDYFFQGNIRSGYAHSYPVAPPDMGRVLLKAILMGEFRFDLEFEADDSVTSAARQEFTDRKRCALTNACPGPKFVYAHTPEPGHSQNSGRCRTNEIALYAGRLDAANAEMREDIETVLRSDPRAIIIVAGDHGPYLTKNCLRTWKNYDLSDIVRLDIQDRYGTFLAIRWPDADYTGYDRITVLQDVFVSVLAYLYGDKRLLDARVPPVTCEPWVTSGAFVTNGVISGGRDDGTPLFLSARPGGP